eukprot:PhF_6_TR17066/c0_g1_i1/m.26135
MKKSLPETESSSEPNDSENHEVEDETGTDKEAQVELAKAIASTPLPSNRRQLIWMLTILCVFVACGTGVLGVFSNGAKQLRRSEAIRFSRFMTRSVVVTYSQIISRMNVTSQDVKIQMAKQLAETYNGLSKLRTELNVAQVDSTTKRITLLSQLRMEAHCGVKCLAFDTQRSFLSRARSGVYDVFYGQGYVPGRNIFGAVTKHTEADVVFLWKSDEGEVDDTYSDAEKEAVFWTVCMGMIGGVIGWVLIETVMTRRSIAVTRGEVWSLQSRLGFAMFLAVYSTLMVIFTGVIANDVYSRNHVNLDRPAYQQLVVNSFKMIMNAGVAVDKKFSQYNPNVVELVNDQLDLHEDTKVEFVMAAAETNTSVVPAHRLRFGALCPNNDCVPGFRKMQIMRYAVFSATMMQIETDYSGTRSVMCSTSRKPYALCEDMDSIRSIAGSMASTAWADSSGIILANFFLIFVASVVAMTWITSQWREEPYPRIPSASRVLTRDGSRAKHVFYGALALIVIGFSTAHTESAVARYHEYEQQIQYDQMMSRLQLYANTIQSVVEKTSKANLTDGDTYRQEFMKEMVVFNKVARNDELLIAQYNYSTKVISFAHILARASECEEPCMSHTITSKATISHTRWRSIVEETSYTGKPVIAYVDIIGNIGTLSISLEDVKDYINPNFRIRGYSACLTLTGLTLFLVLLDILLHLVSTMHQNPEARGTTKYSILRVTSYIVVLILPGAIPALQSAATVQLMSDGLQDLKETMALDTLATTSAYIQESTIGDKTFHRRKGLSARQVITLAVTKFRDTMARGGRDIAVAYYTNVVNKTYVVTQPRYASECTLGDCVQYSSIYQQIVVRALKSVDDGIAVQHDVPDYRSGSSPVSVYSTAIPEIWIDGEAKPKTFSTLMLIANGDFETNLELLLREFVGGLSVCLLLVLGFVSHQLYVLLLSVLDGPSVDWRLHGASVREPFIGLRETMRVLRAPSMPYATRLGLFVMYLSVSSLILLVTMVGLQREATWRTAFNTCEAKLNEASAYQTWSIYHWAQSASWLRMAMTQSAAAKATNDKYGELEELNRDVVMALATTGSKRLLRFIDNSEVYASDATNLVNFLSDNVQRFRVENMLKQYRTFALSYHDVFLGDVRIDPTFSAAALELFQESYTWFQRFILTAIVEFYENMQRTESQLIPLIPTTMKAKWVAYQNARNDVIKLRQLATAVQVTLQDMYDPAMWIQYRKDFANVNAARDVYQHTAYRSLTACEDIPLDTSDVTAARLVGCVCGSLLLVAFLLFGMKNLTMYSEERSKYTRVTITFLFGLILLNSIIPSIEDNFIRVGQAYVDGIRAARAAVLPQTPVLLTQPIESFYMYVGTGNASLLSDVDLDDLTHNVLVSLRAYPEPAVVQFYADRLEKVVRWWKASTSKFIALRNRVSTAKWTNLVACGTMMSGKWNATKWGDMYAPYMQAAQNRGVAFLNGQTAASIVSTLKTVISQSLELESFVWDALLTENTADLKTFHTNSVPDIIQNIESVVKASSDATFLSLRALEPLYTNYLQNPDIDPCMKLVDASINDTSLTYEALAEELQNTQDLLVTDMGLVASTAKNMMREAFDTARYTARDYVAEGSWRAIFSCWALLGSGLLLAVYGFHLGM